METIRRLKAKRKRTNIRGVKEKKRDYSEENRGATTN